MLKFSVALLFACITYSLCFGDMRGVAVTASTYEKTAAWCKDSTCAPWHTMDGDTADASSWRADGSGAWIQYDLGKVRKVDTLKIVFTRGQTRSYFFGVQASADSIKWHTVAEKTTSSGKTAGWEAFALGGITARYVRVIGYGNTNEKFGNWININEVAIVHSAP